MAQRIAFKGVGLREIKDRLRAASAAFVKVGVLASTGGAAIEGETSTGLTVAEIAQLHEYGDPDANLAERSFIRKTMREQEDKIRAFAGKLLIKVVEGKLPMVRALELLGAFGASLIKRAIVAQRIGGPPLQPATIAAKGSSKKLLDRGQLLGAVGFEVAV